jgi:hypothetical protein
MPSIEKINCACFGIHTWFTNLLNDFLFIFSKEQIKILIGKFVDLAIKLIFLNPLENLL